MGSVEQVERPDTFLFLGFEVRSSIGPSHHVTRERVCWSLCKVNNLELPQVFNILQLYFLQNARILCEMSNRY